MTTIPAGTRRSIVIPAPTKPITPGDVVCLVRVISNTNSNPFGVSPIAAVWRLLSIPRSTVTGEVRWTGWLGNLDDANVIAEGAYQVESVQTRNTTARTPTSDAEWVAVALVKVPDPT